MPLHHNQIRVCFVFKIGFVFARSAFFAADFRATALLPWRVSWFSAERRARAAWDAPICPPALMSLGRSARSPDGAAFLPRRRGKVARPLRGPVCVLLGSAGPGDVVRFF